MREPITFKTPFLAESVDFQQHASSLVCLAEAISEGGTLVEFCRLNSLNYSITFAWLRNDPERWEYYQAALDARKVALQDVVLRNMVNAAIVDPVRLINNVQSVDRLTKAEAASITGYKSATDKAGAEIKFTPVAQATETLGKHLGMFITKTELTGKDGGPVAVDDGVSNDVARRLAFILAEASRKKDDAG